MLNLLPPIAEVNSLINSLETSGSTAFILTVSGENFQSKKRTKAIKHTNYEHLINIFSSFQEEFARILNTVELLLQG